MALSLAQRVARLPAAERQAWFATLTPAQATALLRDWAFWPRPEQLAPAGDWTTWLILAGRGWGKTRTAAEWVLDRIRDLDRAALRVADGIHRVALLARTAADAREVMVEGESGLVACARRRGWDATYEPSKRRVTVTTDTGQAAVCTTYSAEEPDQLRGPQHHTAWVDEYAAHADKRDDQGNTAFTNLEFGLRLGLDPRAVVSTTPKPVPWIRALAKDPAVAITRGSTYDNLANLPPAFRRKILERYEGTRVGRQELMAELLEDVEGALWRLADIDQHRLAGRDAMARARDLCDRVVVGVDPSVSATGDEFGMVVVGRDNQHPQPHGYVLADRSGRGWTPEQRARRAVQAYLDFDADAIVVEINNGGDWIPAVIHQVAAQMAAEGHPTGTVPVRTVHASRGKRTRAEPVAALYEQGRIHHVEGHAVLEDQMTTWVPESGQASPDRMDALVWACWDLFVDGANEKVGYLWT